jgi:CDP-2,3-bis-(O-geranylgeranyl)-sn-glycerol synthase
MAKDIFFALWFFLPAAIANVAPIIAAHTPGLRRFDAPVDGGRTFRGRALLGTHKTWRGFIAGMALATVTLWLQQLAVAHSASIRELTEQIDYQALPLLLMGPLLGFGALAGDAIKSFFKRQRGVEPGHSWFPFDQIDYIIGGTVAALPFAVLTAWQYVWVVVIWIIIHLASSYVGYRMGWKERAL